MCSIVGVGDWAGRNAAPYAYTGAKFLQHRGHDSAGIGYANGWDALHAHHGLGLVREAFDIETISTFRGPVATAHVRYRTNGPISLTNAQPILPQGGRAMVCHNGNLEDLRPLKAELIRRGIAFSDEASDSRLIALLINSSTQPTLPEAVTESLPFLYGAYSLIVADNDYLIGVRDPRGTWLLTLGYDGPRTYLATEDEAVRQMGARDHYREVKPGEMVVISEYGTRSYQLATERQATCVFEFIYMARPDTMIGGMLMSDFRIHCGQLLARQASIGGDNLIVVPVLRSGKPAAIGYHEVSNLPYREDLILNESAGQVDRTFLHPDEDERRAKVRSKHIGSRSLRGKRVVVVDDSIVRGTTTSEIIQIIREAGATEVHARIASPPSMWPCYSGVDTPRRSKLIAARHAASTEAIAHEIGADSLDYLTEVNLDIALAQNAGKVCKGCLTGGYPLPLRGDHSRELALPTTRPEPVLSLR